MGVSLYIHLLQLSNLKAQMHIHYTFDIKSLATCPHATIEHNLAS